MLITRPVPTLTSVTASRTALFCGDQRPLTLTATLSQSGGASISYNWPATLPNGWTYQTPAPRTGPSVSVLPSGLPGTVSVPVSASYSCGGLNGTTAQVAATVQVSSQVEPPVASPSLSPDANNRLPGLCGPTAYAAFAPGATSYRWTTSGGITVNGTTTAVGAAVTLAPGPGIGTGTVRIESLNAGNNCEAGATTYSLTYGVPPVRDRVNVQGYCFNYAANGPGSGFLVCPGENLLLTPATLNFAGQGYDGVVTQWEWQLAGGTAVSTTTGPSFFFTAPAQPRQSATVTLRLRNACGWSTTGTFTFTTLDTSGGEEPYRMAQPAAYPNPADATLTLQQPAGTVLTIYSAQGRVVYSGKAGQRPVQLDTRRWPEGLYYLLTRSARTTSRQQLQIKH